MLRRGVRPEERQRAAAADRAHEHDPPAGSPERRQDGLEHRDLPDDVDLELAAKLGEGHELERGGDSDAGVVHEPVKLGSDDRGGGLDLSRVRDVELDRLDAVLTEPSRRPLQRERHRRPSTPPARAARRMRARSRTTRP